MTTDAAYAASVQFSIRCGVVDYFLPRWNRLSAVHARELQCLQIRMLSVSGGASRAGAEDQIFMCPRFKRERTGIHQTSSGGSSPHRRHIVQPLNCVSMLLDT